MIVQATRPTPPASLISHSLYFSPIVSSSFHSFVRSAYGQSMTNTLKRFPLRSVDRGDSLRTAGTAFGQWFISRGSGVRLSFFHRRNFGNLFPANCESPAKVCYIAHGVSRLDNNRCRCLSTIGSWICAGNPVQSREYFICRNSFVR